MILPYKRGVVTLTSRFGWRDLNGTRDYHRGIDLCGTDKVLVAPCDGIVGASTMITDRADLTWQWGNYVRIDADDGLRIYLCHMASRSVRLGQRVKAGDTLGIEGDTGYSFGSHCHFEVRANGDSVDPTPLLGIKNEWGEYDVKKLEKDKKADVKSMDNTPSDWAREAVQWALDNGIVFGDERGDLKLHEPCTREQMMVFLHRLADSEG